MSRYATRPLALNDPRHGTRTGYTYWQCRCDLCRAANTASVTDYLARAPLQREAKRARDRQRKR